MLHLRIGTEHPLPPFSASDVVTAPSCYAFILILGLVALFELSWNLSLVLSSCEYCNLWASNCRQTQSSRTRLSKSAFETLSTSASTRTTSNLSPTSAPFRHGNSVRRKSCNPRCRLRKHRALRPSPSLPSRHPQASTASSWTRVREATFTRPA